MQCMIKFCFVNNYIFENIYVSLLLLWELYKLPELLRAVQHLSIFKYDKCEFDNQRNFSMSVLQYRILIQVSL
jgi:hypothetical protein